MKTISHFQVAGNSLEQKIQQVVLQNGASLLGRDLVLPAVYRLYPELSLDYTTDKPLMICIKSTYALAGKVRR